MNEQFNWLYRHHRLIACDGCGFRWWTTGQANTCNQCGTIGDGRDKK